MWTETTNESQEVHVSRSKAATIVGAILFAVVCADGASGGEYWDNPDPRDELMRGLLHTTVSLEDGVEASTRHGTPISAEYKIDEGRLQLSVVTTGDDRFDDRFWEVIIDQRTGTVAQVGPLSGSEDRAAAPGRRRAMMKATRSLQNAIAEAVRVHSGYRAVSAKPSLTEERPIATVILFDGSDWKTVSIDLK
jgi:hypothetical protein